MPTDETHGSPPEFCNTEGCRELATGRWDGKPICSECLQKEVNKSVLDILSYPISPLLPMEEQ